MRHENMKRELKKLKCHQSEDSETQVPIEDAALKQFDDLLQSNSNGLQSKYLLFALLLNTNSVA